MTSRRWGSKLLVCALLPLGAAGCFSSSSGGGTPDASFDAGSMPAFALLSGSSTNEAFGSVAVGSTSASSTLTITNTGQDASGTIATSISGPDGAAFVIDSDGCNGMSLPANGTCTLAVHFAPTKSGASSATLSVSATPGGSVDVALSGTATGGSPATIAFTTSAQSFGSVGTGSMSAPSTFTLSNGGGSATGAITLALGGADAAQFVKSNDGCSGKPLAPSATCTVDVRFAPTTTGALAATLTASDPAGDMAHVALSGTGGTEAAFTVTPSTHDFGSLTVGTTSSAQTFTVTNTGGTSSGVPSVIVTGTNASDFSVTNGCTAALAPGKTCAFTATFTPSLAMAEGPATATVSASGATSGSTSLTGTGLAAAAISISPTAEPWGTYAWGTTSTDVAFTVTNNGGTPTGALTVSLTGSDAAQFALGTGSTCSGAQLAASGGTCLVYAHFAPSSPATGTVQASLTVAGTPGGTVAAALSGDAESPASIAFGQGTYTLGPTTVGMSSSPVTLTIVNSGGVASGVPGAPSITGPNAGDFAVVSNNCTASIPGMGISCTMSVVFTPQTPLGEQATITVAASPGGTAQATLSGTGLTTAALAITPDPGNTFAATTLGKTSAPVTFTVKNSGQTATSALLAPSFSGGTAGDFAVVGGTDGCTGASLAASGGTCTFQVTVTPSTGAESTTLVVQDGSGDSATDPLSATGLSATALSLSPDPGNTFANTAQGQTSPPVLFTLTNTGQTTSGVINAPTSAGGNSTDFVLVTSSDGCAGVTLSQNASCTFQVTFSPTTSMTESTTLSVTDGSGNSATDPLTGTGFTPVAQLQVTPSPYSFPDTLGGGSNFSSQAFAIKNVGTGPTTAVSIQGAVKPFSQTNNCPASLGAGQSCTMTVTFTPPGFGPYSATISVVDTTSDTASLPVSGNGVSSSWYLIVTPSPGAFGLVKGGTSKTLTFTATNYGKTSLPIGISNVYFIGNYPLFSANLSAGGSPCNGAILGELQSCTFTMTYSPPGTGTGTVSGENAQINGQTYVYATVPLTGSY